MSELEESEANVSVKGRRAFVFTWNNYTEETVKFLGELKCKYLLYGKEIAPTTLTPHLQGYVYFDDLKTASAARKILKGSDVRYAKADADRQWDYICGPLPFVYHDKTKADKTDFDPTPFVKGVKPMNKVEKGECGVKRCADAIIACREGRLSDIPADLLVGRLKNIQYAVQELDKVRYVPDLSDLPGYRGDHHEWHWGVPDSGKSHYCFERPGTFKMKAGIKMDLYAHQPFVAVEDVKQNAACDEHTTFYQALLDQTPFIADVKYGSMNIRPRSVRINANFHPNQIWDGINLVSIESRVKIYHWTKKFKSEDWINPVTGLGHSTEDEPGPDWTEPHP